jgi:hypothetical protein
LSPNIDPGRITVAASQAFQTSSRQLDPDDVFRALALVRDDQGQSGDHALSMRMRAVSVSMISEFGAGVTLISRLGLNSIQPEPQVFSCFLKVGQETLKSSTRRRMGTRPDGGAAGRAHMGALPTSKHHRP